MTITAMTAHHVPQVAALEALCFCDPWSESSVASELQNPLALWLVALDNDQVVGYVGSQTVPDETDMMNIAVHPDYRRQGIAEALVDSLVAPLSLTNALIVAIAAKREKELSETFNNLERIWEAYHVYEKQEDAQ